MKIEVRAITIRGAEKPGSLFDEAVHRITLAEDENKTETDWFAWGGFFWNLNAEITLHTEMIQYDYDSPPEVDKLDVSVKFRAFECTNEEGDYVDVTFLDEKSREISAEDVLVKRIEDDYFMHAL